MTVQLSDAVRNAMVNAYETAIGTAPKLQLRTGAPPANCAAAATGTLLAELTLPSDWQNAASGGSGTKLGTWSGTGIAAGTMGHYRIVDTAGTTCHDQGTVGTSGADLIVDNTSIAISQPITINTWTTTQGNP